MNNIPDNHSTTRIKSIDALRGLDMIFLVGISGIFRALPQWSSNSLFTSLSEQCHHTPWIGLHAWDLIFPLFIFLAGVSVSLSIKNRLAKGVDRSKLYRHILQRFALLFILGLVQNGLLDLDFPNLIYSGVLQRIAIAYLCTSLIVMHTKMSTQLVTALLLLISYWLLMNFVPVPGYGAGVITPQGNLHTYVDQLVLPGKLNNEFYDEDGVLQQISSIAVCLAGAGAGNWLSSNRSSTKKARLLLVAGVVCIITGIIWSAIFPVIFRLWTSSFAMLAIGISSILLGCFYWFFDVNKHDKIAYPFIVVGMNSILIYLLGSIINFHQITLFFVGGIIKYTGNFAPVFVACAVTLIQYLLLYGLYKKKIFLKI